MWAVWKLIQFYLVSNMYLLLLAGIILGLSFYLDKKQGDEYKMYIPYIGFVNTRLWGSIITTLLILFVINS